MNVSMQTRLKKWSSLKPLLAVMGATVWIALSEFSRNQIILISEWRNHFNSMDLTFPEHPINGVFWFIWSLGLAIAIYILSRKFNNAETVSIAWLTAFGLMWIALGNLKVLPVPILVIAVPLSIIEVYIATCIVRFVHAR